MEDDQGVIFAKLREKGSFKDWLGKMFIPNSPNSQGQRNPRRILSSSSMISLDSPSTQSRWESYAQEIEDYFQHLLSLNLDEQDCVEEESESVQQQSLMVELATPEHAETDLVICQIYSKKKKN